MDSEANFRMSSVRIKRTLDRLTLCYDARIFFFFNAMKIILSQWTILDPLLMFKSKDIDWNYLEAKECFVRPQMSLRQYFNEFQNSNLQTLSREILSILIKTIRGQSKISWRFYSLIDKKGFYMFKARDPHRTVNFNWDPVTGVIYKYRGAKVGDFCRVCGK